MAVDRIPQVYVCTNKFCDSRGSNATIATFNALIPPSLQLPVQGINCLNRCNKGPNARILTPGGLYMEASSLDSVEKIVEFLQEALKIDINLRSAEVLKLNYEGNSYIKSGKVDEAIQCFDEAILLDEDKEQEGILLVMRGTAYLQRALTFRMRYDEVIRATRELLPTLETIRAMFAAALSLSPPLCYRLLVDSLAKAAILFDKLDSSNNWGDLITKYPELRDSSGKLITSGEDLFKKAKFLWALYETSIMCSLQDTLTATLVTPGFAQAWRRAAEGLQEARLYHSAIEYYEISMQLDSKLAPILLPSTRKLKVFQKLLENAQTKGMNADELLSTMNLTE